MKNTKITILVCLAISLAISSIGCRIVEVPIEDSSISTNSAVSEVKEMNILIEGTGENAVYKGMQFNLDQKYPAPKELKSPSGKPLNEVIGIVGTGGEYNFTSLPYMRENAEMISKDIGSKVIKLWLTNQYSTVYKFNHEWGEYNTVKDLAASPYYKKVFGMDFKTFILAAYELGLVNWLDGVSGTEKSKVENEFYELTKYLLTTYAGSGKTFVLQNWEGDNMLDGSKYTDAQMKGITDYFNARQDGILKARSEITSNNVNVYGAIEVNKVSIFAVRKLVDDVLPNTYADLYSYSNWSTKDDAERLVADLELIAEKAPDSKAFGSKNVYLGEFGAGEMVSGGNKIQRRISETQLRTAVEWGCPYVVYWDLMCNGRKTGDIDIRPVNKEMAGFWLIRPDGTFSSMFWVIKGLFDNKDYNTSEPKLKLKLPPVIPPKKPIEFKESDIIFDDDLTDFSKIKDYSDKLQMSMIEAVNEKYFAPYGGDYSILAKIAEPSQYVTYEVKSAKMAYYIYVYSPPARTHTKLQESKDGVKFEDVKITFQETRKNEWADVLVTAELKSDTKYARIFLTNEGSPNLWDPLLRRVIFIK